MLRNDVLVGDVFARLEAVEVEAVTDDGALAAGIDALEKNGVPVTAGVVGPDPAIGGNDSNNEAPNEEVGLKGFKAVIPVKWDLTGVAFAMDGVFVWTEGKAGLLPKVVFWNDNGGDAYSVVVEGVAVFVPSVFREMRDVKVVAELVGLLFAKANDEATLEMFTAPGFNELLPKLNPFTPVGCDCTCCELSCCGCCCSVLF
jgi:hypothetical protein